jgi:hypothetical protein
MTMTLQMSCLKLAFGVWPVLSRQNPKHAKPKRLGILQSKVSVANGGAVPHCRGGPLSAPRVASSRQRNGLFTVTGIWI